MSAWRFQRMLVAFVFLAAWPDSGEASTIKGRVVDAGGRPVAGAVVDATWKVRQRDLLKPQGMQPPSLVTTDADGRFTLDRPSFGLAEMALLAFGPDRTTGGLVLAPIDNAEEVEIRVLPLVRVHGRLTFQDRPAAPKWCDVFLDLPAGRRRLIDSDADAAEFTLLVPPGEYELGVNGEGTLPARWPISIPRGRAEVDVGAFDVPSTVLARARGREAPAWSVAAARGMKADATPADYRGKWVLLVFWGCWADPSVRLIGELIDLRRDYAAFRDRFEVIAVHDTSVEDLDELDEAVADLKAAWTARDLPFPVAIDDGGTAEAYGVLGLPASFLIDPDGKLVGAAAISDLEAKLPPEAIGVRIARALDADLTLAMEGGPLAEAVAQASRFGHIPIAIDEPALKAAGVATDATSRLKLRGRATLRSWLELLLDPFHLEAAPGASGLVVAPAKKDRDRRPSERQRLAAARIEQALDRPSSFEVRNYPLGELVDALAAEARESFILDPAGLASGAIDPAATVSGVAKDTPLRTVLADLLEPLGLAAVVRSEAVVIEKR